MRIICPKCALKDAMDDEWRKKNSEAQKKVQGSEEARSRMSKILKKTHKDNPGIRIKISKGLKRAYENDPELRNKISEASKENWKRPEYREKVTGKQFHHGYFVSRFGQRIYFASSWELMFLCWCDANENVVDFRSCEDKIPYRQPSGKKARYYPDFDVVFKNNTRWVTEVKGSRSDFDIVERKRIAAVENYDDDDVSYRMFFGDDLKRLGIFRPNRKVRAWIAELIDKGKVVDYGFGSENKKS